MPNPMRENKTLKEKFAKDPHRPQYHFLPPANWMNDPNGSIQWKGEYHLFYQHNPYGPFWSTMYWGHAVSKDLVHWTHLPIALAPTPDGPDKDGCFSGCAVDNNGIPTLIYTGVKPERQCIATSKDDLLTWEKHPDNPVIASPPEGLEVTGFRDPCAWKEGDTWYLILGSGIKDVGGTAFLYRSKDLIHWNYIHPLFIGDKNETGEMWECPNFFPLNGKYVFLYSPTPEFLYTRYFIGTYVNYKFVPESKGNTDFGGYFYAAQTFLDDKGRRIMWGWLKEGRSDKASREAGWVGVMSLPRLLSILPNGQLGMEPAPELRMLRDKPYQLVDINLTPESFKVLKEIEGDCLEIVAELEPNDASEFGIKLRSSPDGEEETLVVCDLAQKRLVINGERSSLSSEVNRDVRGGHFELRDGESLKLHIFLDRSVVEVFANGRACVTGRIYPSRDDSLGVDLFTLDGCVRFKSLKVWEVKSIWR